MKPIIKNILIFFAVIFVIILIYVIVQVALYFNYQHNNYLMIKECNSEKYTFKNRSKEPNNCYNKMYSLLLPEILTNDVKLKNNEKLKFYKIDENSSYLIPTFTMKDTDALFGYGIGPSCHFEDNYVKLFNKKVYAFDCAHNSNSCKNAEFIPECIATDKYMITNVDDIWIRVAGVQKSLGKIHHFKDKIKQLNLEGKKIYLKMDIAGAEDDALPEIIENSDDIIGISVIMHMDDAKTVLDKLKTLKLLNKKFVLVSRRYLIFFKGSPDNAPENDGMPKYTTPVVNGCLSLTYVNKNIVEKYHTSFNQKNDETQIILNGVDPRIEYNAKYDISWVVVLAEKLKNLFNIQYN